jgi:hypothetical protein
MREKGRERKREREIVKKKGGSVGSGGVGGGIREERDARAAYFLPSHSKTIDVLQSLTSDGVWRG